MAINRREIFKAAHFKARLTVINTRSTAYARTYSQAFADALRHEYAKLRQEQERLDSIKAALAPPVPPTYSLNSSYTRRFRIGGNRNTLSVGA